MATGGLLTRRQAGGCSPIFADHRSPGKIHASRTGGRPGAVPQQPAFLLEVFDGNDNAAAAVNRLLVVGFYLLNLGFLSLTLRATGEVTSARQAVQLLSVKIGETLLVIGAAHFANLVIFARIRSRYPQRPLRPAGPSRGPR